MRYLLRWLLLFAAIIERGTVRAQYIKLLDAVSTSTSDTAIAVNKSRAVVVAAKQGDVVLFPNPAVDELNVLYDPNADVKSIAIYNLIGKQMMVNKTSGTGSANLNIESLPGGIYYVWLMNSLGDVVATKKFTKQ